MGLPLFRPRRWSALLLSLVAALALTLSDGALLRTQAQDVPGGALYLKFSADTFRDPPGFCQYDQYKLLAQPVQVVQGVRRQIHAGIEVGAALNKISPTYLEIQEHDPAGIFLYDAQNIGDETIAYTAYQKTKLSDNEISQPEIAHGTLQFKVKACVYKVTLQYVFSFPLGSVFGLMTEARLARKPDKSYAGDGPFEFQQMVDVAPCVASFTVINAPTHIDGTVDATNKLTLKFKYSNATTTISAVCPIAGGASASRTVNPASLGLTEATFPEEGGSRTFAALLGGQITVTVSREANP